MIQKIGSSLFVIFGLALAGCAASDGSDNSSAGAQSNVAGPGENTDGMIYQQSVTFRADGTQKIESRWLTLEEDARLREAKERILAEPAAEIGDLLNLVQDSGCSASALWLYSGTSYTGYKICFVSDSSANATQVANLNQYVMYSNYGCLPSGYCGLIPRAYWAGNVRSFLGGYDPFRFAQSSTGCGTLCGTLSHVAYDGASTATTCEQAADLVYMKYYCE